MSSPSVAGGAGQFFSHRGFGRAHPAVRGQVFPGSHGRDLFAPARDTLVRIGDPQESAFGERLAKELKTYREFSSALVDESAGDADPANSREIGGNRENIRKVHFQRIAGAFADRKGDFRRGGTNNRIHLLEGLHKVLADKGADLLCPEV